MQGIYFHEKMPCGLRGSGKAVGEIDGVSGGGGKNVAARVSAFLELMLAM